MQPTDPSGGSPPQAGFVRLLRDELAKGLVPGLGPEDVRGEFLDGGRGAGLRLDLAWHRPATRSRVGAEIDRYGDVTVFEQPEDWPLSGRSAREEYLFARRGYPPVPEWDEQQRGLSREAVGLLVEVLGRT